MVADHDTDELVPVPCRSCGFDLQRQPAGGTCPECGVPVVHTVRDRPPRRRSSILLVLAAFPGWFLLQIAYLSVALQVNAFSIFENPFLMGGAAAPVLFVGGAAVLRARGARFHWPALAVFSLLMFANVILLFLLVGLISLSV